MFDSELTDVRYDVRGNEILRILPISRLVEEGWITDKIRYSFDGFKRQKSIVSVRV